MIKGGTPGCCQEYIECGVDHVCKAFNLAGLMTMRIWDVGYCVTFPQLYHTHARPLILCPVIHVCTRRLVRKQLAFTGTIAPMNNTNTVYLSVPCGISHDSNCPNCCNIQIQNIFFYYGQDGIQCRKFSKINIDINKTL